ncbi:MAG TPA: hypothetical protein ENI70_00385 [Candidatus Peregrinibacteria bacterium]|nr:hypothetical protein [Candidatus Peregrinibacteria bacterium]
MPSENPPNISEDKEFDPEKRTNEFLEEHGEPQTIMARGVLFRMREAETEEAWKEWADFYTKVNNPETAQKLVAGWKEAESESKEIQKIIDKTRNIDLREFDKPIGRSTITSAQAM